MRRQHQLTEAQQELLTSIRLRAVPPEGVIARGQYSQQAIDELEQMGFAVPLDFDHRGRTRIAGLSTAGRIARSRLLNPNLSPGGVNRD